MGVEDCRRLPGVCCEASEAMRLSARGYHRVLRVARTLADLDGAERVGRAHFAEALAYRMLADEMRRAA
jgi:magnesium chelatase family protein